MMKSLRPILCAALIGATTLPAFAQAPANPDNDFIASVQSQMLGIYALGTLARDHAQSAEVKSVASSLATDAAAANVQLKTIAKAHDVTLPDKPNVRFDAQYGDMQSLKGNDFDAKFREDMNVDLSFAEDQLSQELQNGTDATLKSFAKTQLAAVKKAEAQLSK